MPAADSVYARLSGLLSKASSTGSELRLARPVQRFYWPCSVTTVAAGANQGQAHSGHREVAPPTIPTRTVWSNAAATNTPVCNHGMRSAGAGQMSALMPWQPPHVRCANRPITAHSSPHSCTLGWPLQLALSGLQSNAATGWQEMSLSHSSSALPTTPSFSPVCLSSTTLRQGSMGEQPCCASLNQCARCAAPRCQGPVAPATTGARTSHSSQFTHR